jgi:hypothetical protein
MYIRRNKAWHLLHGLLRGFDQERYQLLLFLRLDCKDVDECQYVISPFIVDILLTPSEIMEGGKSGA